MGVQGSQQDLVLIPLLRWQEVQEPHKLGTPTNCTCLAFLGHLRAPWLWRKSSSQSTQPGALLLPFLPRQGPRGAAYL